jgi:hypothetical protein
MSVNLKIVITFCLLTLVAALLALPKVTLGYASDNSTISVNVGQVSEITVLPTSLSWANIPPGGDGTTQSLDIQNTGSTPVSQIHAYVSTLDNETTRPYGGDAVEDYAATGVVVIRNETNTSIYFAGRIEWNWTEDISYKDISALGNGACDGGADNCSWGFIRNSSYEYMWAISNGTDATESGFCNLTDAQLALESDEDTGAVDGSTRTPTTGDITNNGADAYWSYFHVTRADHLLADSCVAVSWNCTKIYLYKYDMRSGATDDFDTCTYARYLQETDLNPREEHTITLNVYMPYGIPDGNMATGIIYVEAKT